VYSFLLHPVYLTMQSVALTFLVILGTAIAVAPSVSKPVDAKKIVDVAKPKAAVAHVDAKKVVKPAEAHLNAKDSKEVKLAVSAVDAKKVMNEEELQAEIANLEHLSPVSGEIEAPYSHNAAFSHQAAAKTSDKQQKENVDVAKLKNSVFGNPAFQKKVKASCAHKHQSNCESKTSQALFCQLLRRSKPETFEEVCSGASSSFTQTTKGINDPCSGIACAASLKCPAGFSVTKVAGHCCPYCVNPNIKVEAAITGATGSKGGKASTFCPKVWCFPTACTKAISNPTTTNGACCPTCPAL